ncbi:MAG: LPXTG cell wall anchor domain-containing protein [Pontixanthobacter sp.]
MNPKLFTFLIAFALAAPAHGTPGSVRDFQLRPAPSPSATPQVQGPVDTEGAVPVRPRVIPAPSSTPSQSVPASAAPGPSPTRTAAPGAAPSSVSRSTPTAQAETRQTPPRQSQTNAPAQPTATPLTSPQLPASDTPEESAPSPQATSSPVSTSETEPTSSGHPVTSQETNWLGWIVIIAGLILLALGGWLFWRKREQQAQMIPQIELPLVKPVPDDDNVEQETPLPTTISNAAAGAIPETKTSGFSAAKSKFQVKVAAQSLSRSMMNATLQYRLELQNLGSAAIGDISVHADVVTAHSQAPLSEQLADTESDLPFAAFVPKISSRDAQVVDGEYRLPLRLIRAIAQGKTQLFVPLLRLKIESADIDPVIHTFVVGIRPPDGTGKLLPFRLDEMAQTYRNIGLRQLA